MIAVYPIAFMSCKLVTKLELHWSNRTHFFLLEFRAFFISFMFIQIHIFLFLMANITCDPLIGVCSLAI